MEKKKIIASAAVVAAIVLGATFTAVGGKFKQEEKVNLILSNVTSSSAKEAGLKFKELVEEYSDGTVTVDVFQDNQLGDDKTSVEGVQVGDIDIAVSSTSSLSTMYKDYYMFDTPYLFLNSDEVYDIGFGGEAGEKIMEGVEDVGLRGMAMWENGFRNYTNDKIPVSKPEDVKGQKIRTMENDIHLKAWSAIGANPTPMAFSELFTAMQQGTVDGEENPTNILFICGGAFEGIDKIIEKRIDQKSIGFNAEIAENHEDNLDRLLNQVLPQDLVKFGLIPEFVGRVPVVVALESLNRDALIQILTEPKSSIVKQYQKLMELDGVRLHFDKDALEAIADRSIARNTGARGLRAIMENVMMDIMYRAPSDETLKTCIITRDVVEGKSLPKTEHEERESESA